MLQMNMGKSIVKGWGFWVEEREKKKTNSAEKENGGCNCNQRVRGRGEEKKVWLFQRMDEG